MSEFALTMIRLGFLGLLWIAVFSAVAVLRRDLAAQREERGVVVTPNAPVAQGSSRRGRRSSGRKLTVVDGELKGTAVPLSTSVITIGRAADSTIVLREDYVSNKHARIYPSGSDWVVEDLGSTNGTWIEKTRIATPTVLEPGQSLRIGRTTMRIGK